MLAQEYDYQFEGNPALTGLSWAVALVGVGLSIFVLVDATRRPDWVWPATGQSKALWITLGVLGIFPGCCCGLAGIAVGATYLAAIRSKLEAAQAGGFGGSGYGPPPGGFGQGPPPGSGYGPPAGPFGPPPGQPGYGPPSGSPGSGSIPPPPPGYGPPPGSPGSGSVPPPPPPPPSPGYGPPPAGPVSSPPPSDGPERPDRPPSPS